MFCPSTISVCTHYFLIRPCLLCLIKWNINTVKLCVLYTLFYIVPECICRIGFISAQRAPLYNFLIYDISTAFIDLSVHFFSLMWYMFFYGRSNRMKGAFLLLLFCLTLRYIQDLLTLLYSYLYPLIPLRLFFYLKGSYFMIILF